MIVLNSYGSGNAYVSNQFPSDGETIILTCLPDSGATLDDIIATDIDGHSIALYVQQQQQITYRASWGAMIIDVYFSGSTPPPHSHFPLWLLFKVRDGNKYVK